MAKEIMTWTVDQSAERGTYKLRMRPNTTFRQFLNDILGRYDNHGLVYIREEEKDKEPEYMSMTYGHGVVTWCSTERINRLGDCFVLEGVATGFPTHVDYTIQIKKRKTCLNTA